MNGSNSVAVHSIKLCRTLKYSSRSLQVTLLPPISFSTSRSGAKRRGTSSASSLLKSASMSETHKHTLWVSWKALTVWSGYQSLLWSANSPVSLPSKQGLVATLSPGCGSRKQAMWEKQEWMCFLTFCSSSCWFCFTCVSRRVSFDWCEHVHTHEPLCKYAQANFSDDDIKRVCAFLKRCGASDRCNKWVWPAAQACE